MTQSPADTDDPRHWQEALALVDELLDLPVAERDAALEQALVGATARRLARRLLAAAGRRSVLDEALQASLAGGSEADLLAGRRLGRWLLTDLLGRGGMSVVYRARSLEPPLGQVAAVKLLSLAAATPAGRARFEREIDILVRLRHPGIAPVYEAGVAEDGTPWFAMALVDGVDIERWCADQDLGVAARVALMLQVCAAVEHAHRHLVIHRDIKPGNVLVDREGRVVLLDFGISRMLEEGAMELTSAGTYAFTPRYAAPEQLHGGPITTASDVYSLGSLLHKLLIGQAPQFPAGDGAAECRDPVSLLAAGAPRSLRMALAGDLGAILRKSLARDPGRRYPGAAELAEDLGRWRDGRPVTARRGGWAYAARRFVARHRLATTLAAGLVLSVLGGLVASLWQAERARQAQVRAETELARAEAVRGYVVNVFAAADPSRGKDTTAGELLHAGVERVTAELERSQPAVAADLLSLIGEAYRKLGEDKVAETQQRRALALLDAAGDEASRTRVRVRYELGDLARHRGEHAAAIEHYREALALARLLGLPREEQLSMGVYLATARSAAGGTEQPLDELHELLAEIRAAGLEGGGLHLRALDTLSTAIALAGGDNYPLQEERLRVAAGVYAELPGWLAFTYADTLPTFRRARDFTRAQALAEEAIELADATYAGPNVIAAIAYCNAGGLALQRGQVEAALTLVGRAIEMDRTLDRRHIHAWSCLMHRAEAHGWRRETAAALADLEAAAAMLDGLKMAEDGKWRTRGCLLRAWVLLRGGLGPAAAGTAEECGPEPQDQALEQLVRAELAATAGDWAAADHHLEAWRQANPLTADAPDRLRGWQLDWALAARVDHGEAERRRAALLAAAAAIPGDWHGRAELLACLADPASPVGCLDAR